MTEIIFLSSHIRSNYQYETSTEGDCHTFLTTVQFDIPGISLDIRSISVSMLLSLCEKHVQKQSSRGIL